MELLLAAVVGCLYASGIYLMLKRRLAPLIVGLSLIGNGSNLLIFTASGVTRDRAPIVDGISPVTPETVADPVPQSLVLTAIVIGFGVLAFSLVLAHRVHRSTETDDLDAVSTGTP